MCELLLALLSVDFGGPNGTGGRSRQPLNGARAVRDVRNHSPDDGEENGHEVSD